MTEHLPPLQIIIPLLAAPLCVVLRHRIAVRILAVLVAWMCLAISILLLQQVLDTGPISYTLGGWTPPLGIEYHIDALNAYMLLIISTIASVVVPFEPGVIRRSVSGGREHLYYAAFLLCITGLLGICITGDAFNVFVFLEISSLASYSLVALGRRRQALMAAFSYLIMGTIGGTFILLGIGLMYQMTGTLNMRELSQLLPSVMETRTIYVAFAFLAVGSSIKLAVFPLHQWLPNAYTHAPVAVSAFLAGTATKVSYYVFVKVIFVLFGAGFIFGNLKIHFLLIPLSILAMFIGSLSAIYQTNIKRLLAYSSIAQIGYMTLGLSFNNVEGLTGGLVHMWGHALMKGGLFLVVGCISFQLGTRTIEDMKGLGKRMPLTCAAFVVGGLGLIGVPGTVGFISKCYLILGALKNGWLGAAILILLSSLLAVIYVWKIIEIAYFEEPDPDAPSGDPPLSMLIPAWILIGASVFFGFYTDFPVSVASKIAGQLLGVTP